MTSGQSRALWQLREIFNADGHSLVIEQIREPTDTDPWLRVTVSIRVGQVPTAENGLPLRERETFLFLVPATFPFRKPDVQVTHLRFAGKPHVQWGKHLCLYQSSTEWNPTDGMFGLIDRLEYWLRQGAVNQLDPEGEPLHPPVVYADYENGKLIIPKENTPPFDGAYWLGVAGISNFPKRVEITGWYDLNNIPTQGACALALLFSQSLPWEYPTKGADLFRECERQGVPQEFLFRILKVACILTPTGQPVYCIVGSPMRGIAGGPRKQHLSVWAIDPQTAGYVRATIGESGDTAEVSELRIQFEGLLVSHLGTAKISWCPVIEGRPEVTIRRDYDSILSRFHGKAISIWGCGALGAHIAICLCRAGARKLALHDKGIVTPGILVRQPYHDDDVGEFKVEALKRHLLEIRPELEIQTYTSNLENDLSLPGFEWSGHAELIIDATASDIVRRRLELIRNSDRRPRVPIATIMIDQRAKCLVTAIVMGDFSGGTWDVLRKTKLEMLRAESLAAFADSFFPSQAKERPFQPEPGCSEPTFVGSSADSSGLAAIGLNLIASELVTNPSMSAISHLFAQPSEAMAPFGGRSARFEYYPDFLISLNDHEIRISHSALREIKAWIAQNRRRRDRRVETGGLLWGEWDEATGIVWVSSASGPPSDSHHSEELFVCGVKGTKEEHEARITLSRRSVGYLGMWHTHPISQPIPSDTDIQGMHQILTSGALPHRKNLLLIIGMDGGHDTVGAYLFRRISGDDAFAMHELRQGRQRLPEPLL